ncbi:hypothetical protein U1Q18_042400 [Sarracenia purpurea var. burkii]
MQQQPPPGNPNQPPPGYSIQPQNGQQMPPGNGQPPYNAANQIPNIPQPSCTLIHAYNANTVPAPLGPYR